MNTNPFKSPELSSPEDPNADSFDPSVLPVLLWSNVVMVTVYVLFSTADWLYVDWFSMAPRQIRIAWSKLFFMLVTTNVIIYFAFKHRYRGGEKG